MNRRWWLLGGLGLSCGALAVVACGGDDNGTGTGAVTPDGGLDSTTMEDAPVIDSGSPPVEASDVDSAKAPDASADAGACTAYDASGLDEASVTAGFEQVWRVYRCAGCHQKPSATIDDAGGGIVLSGNNNGLGDSGMIFPPNLTGDPTTGLGCWTDSQIQNAILTGIDDEGKTLCSPMPKFGSPSTTADGGLKAGFPMDAGTAHEIVEYLRSLAVVVNKVTDTTCPAPDGGADAAADAH